MLNLRDTQRWEQKNPALISAMFRGNQRRARFYYDDLLALFTFYEFRYSSAAFLLASSSRDLVIDARTGPLPKVCFLVARLQYASIFHHHA